MSEAQTEFHLTQVPGIFSKVILGWSLEGVNQFCGYMVFFLWRRQPVPYARLSLYVCLRTLGWIALTWSIFLFLDHMRWRSPWMRIRILRLVPFVLAVCFADLCYNVLLMTVCGVFPVITITKTFETLLVLDFHQTLLWLFLIVAVGEGVRYYYMKARSDLRESELRGALLRSHIETLNSRLEPHFLFNALHGVSALMHTDVDNADRMVYRIGELLRTVIKTADGEMVTVEKELKLADQYLAVQKFRFADRMRVDVDCAPDARRLQVPRFILQPLVENAVRHGIEQLSGPGIVAITARILRDRLMLSVRNTAPPSTMTAEGTGQGLANLRARLELLFPQAHEIRLESTGETATTTIELPVVQSAA